MLIEDARERIAKCINAEPEEIIFTSSGEIDKFSRAFKCKVPTAEAGSQHLTIQVMDLIRIEAELSQRSW